MKTYYLMLSVVFPKAHPRAGQPTSFISKVFSQEKRHTIRDNYQLWKKRIDEVNQGKAVLDLRHWEHKPYNSPQHTFKTLKQGEVSIQKLEFTTNGIYIDERKPISNPVNIETLAANDGLSLTDFNEWFKNADLSKPMAAIQLTEFRY